jgi:glutamine synthetase
LTDAIAALRDSALFRASFGNAFVDYFVHIKAAEIARCAAEANGQAGGDSDVTAWEHREYFDLA